MTTILAPSTAPVVGEETLPRLLATGSTALSTGTLRLGFFKARRTEPITKARASCVTGYTGGTPTLIRFGIYSCTLDSSGLPLGPLALIASTASDTALLAANSTEYEKALSATFNKTAGTWYAMGCLVVTAGTAPNIAGVSPASAAAMAGGQGRPRLTASLGSQTDLPSTIANGSLGTTSFMPYFLLQQS